MLSLLIADDEKVIRESLAECLDWAKIGIEVVGCCANGLEALDAIMDESPDIVMTDIKMPGLNGLELIEKIQEIDKDIEFIILSGYREFDFAQKAIRLGVRRYLLKPVSEEQVLESVLDAIDSCEKARSVKMTMEEHKMLRVQVREHYRQQLQAALFYGGGSVEEAVSGYLERFPGPEKGFFVVDIAPLTLENAQRLSRMLMSELAASGLSAVTDFLFAGDALMAILKGKASGASALIKSCAEEVCPAAAVTVHERASLQAGVERLRQALAPCLHSYTLDEKGYAYALKRNDPAQELLTLPEEDTSDNYLVQTVKNCIRQNLADSTLSLKQIADQYVHVNADYLSRLFVQKTGEKFSHYLNRKRVETAKQLLQADSSKVYQVAEQVGLGHNPRYFGQVFKKYTGITPSAYAERQSSEAAREETP